MKTSADHTNMEWAVIQCMPVLDSSTMETTRQHRSDNTNDRSRTQ